MCLCTLQYNNIKIVYKHIKNVLVERLSREFQGNCELCDKSVKFGTLIVKGGKGY